MDKNKFETHIKQLGFDIKLIDKETYAVGLEVINKDFPDITLFEKSFKIILDGGKYKIEYFHGQIFVEEFFDDIESVVAFIKENLMPENL